MIPLASYKKIWSKAPSAFCPSTKFNRKLIGFKKLPAIQIKNSKIKFKNNKKNLKIKML
jgi:hypothetical protein